jgi:hypothetical protein
MFSLAASMMAPSTMGGAASENTSCTSVSMMLPAQAEMEVRPVEGSGVESVSLPRRQGMLNGGEAEAASSETKDEHWSVTVTGFFDASCTCL